MDASGHASSQDVGSKPIVCFLGPISSYTHQATSKTFPPEQFDLMPVTTIKDIFDTTQSGAATYGVVPFENSTNGSVVFTLDHFADRSSLYRDLNVCREIYLDVHHCLLGHNHHRNEAEGAEGAADPDPDPNPILSRVRRVYSHPQAFGQCTAFLGSRLRGVETVDVSSTSRAAELALQDKSGGSAAISSAAAADLLGLDVLARNIEDRDDNTTRFFVLRRGVEGGDDVLTTPASSTAPSAPATATATAETGAVNAEGKKEEGKGDDDDDDANLLSGTKSLLSFTVPHRSPGALADVLSCFRRGGLNLTSINSRPSLTTTSSTTTAITTTGPGPGSGSGSAAFEYIFFVEFEGHRFRDPRGRVARVLADVAAVAATSRWLGSWENMRKNVG